MSKVLVVEDEFPVASFLTDLFETLGHQCRKLARGHDVIATARLWQPQLITLDIGIPSPNGLEVMQQLRNDRETKSIPIFIVSAHIDKTKYDKELSLANGVFEKPLDVKKFSEEVRKICK